jgi:hypothetical protein
VQTRQSPPQEPEQRSPLQVRRQQVQGQQAALLVLGAQALRRAERGRLPLTRMALQHHSERGPVLPVELPLEAQQLLQSVRRRQRVRQEPMSWPQVAQRQQLRVPAGRLSTVVRARQ